MDVSGIVAPRTLGFCVGFGFKPNFDNGPTAPKNVAYFINGQNQSPKITLYKVSQSLANTVPFDLGVHGQQEVSR